jgi:hypothetical protein
MGSAGSLVGRTRQGHQEFMALIKQDHRYQRNPNYLFLTTIISGEDLAQQFANTVENLEIVNQSSMIPNHDDDSSVTLDESSQTLSEENVSNASLEQQEQQIYNIVKQIVNYLEANKPKAN